MRKKSQVEKGSKKDKSDGDLSSFCCLAHWSTKILVFLGETKPNGKNLMERKDHEIAQNVF